MLSIGALVGVLIFIDLMLLVKLPRRIYIWLTDGLTEVCKHILCFHGADGASKQASGLESLDSPDVPEIAKESVIFTTDSEVGWGCRE